MKTVFNCPVCGEEKKELREGYCPECCQARQDELDEHNARFDWWEGLSPNERDEQIRRASNGGV